MSTLHPTLDHATHDDHVGHAHGHHELTFIQKYVFSTDHKIIGIQFLITTLLMLMVGGALALGVRWQLARPWERMPILGDIVFGSDGGQISPEAY
ncbi:MAG: cytochrome c oxidase subunit I, partial [Planctomycetes bacterium]|nr:cytochrome c oxidase subunit I [Planctomycetota bacterium]